MTSARRPKMMLWLLAAAVLAAVAYNAWSKLPYQRLPIASSRPRALVTSLGTPALQPTFADLPYADRSRYEKLDLYLPPEGPGLAPLVIWIHGGGLTVGDKRSMPRINFGPPPKPMGRNGPYQIQVPDVGALNAKGYAVVSLNYRLGMMLLTDVGAAVEDAKAAVRFLRGNAAKYRLNPSQFAVWGNSMGGYMAAMVGATGDQPTRFDAPGLGYANVSSAVQAVVVWYGAEDRLPLATWRIGHYLRTAKSIPAFLIAAGDADPIISPAQARRLHEALLARGADSTLTILHGAGHEDPAYMQTQMIPTFQFLDKTFGR